MNNAYATPALESWNLMHGQIQSENLKTYILEEERRPQKKEKTCWVGL